MIAYSPDTDFLSNVGCCVDVHLVELDIISRSLRELFENRGDHAARTTPGRPEVEHGVLVFLDLLKRMKV